MKVHITKSFNVRLRGKAPRALDCHYYETWSLNGDDLWTLGSAGDSMLSLGKVCQILEETGADPETTIENVTIDGDPEVAFRALCEAVANKEKP